MHGEEAIYFLKKDFSRKVFIIKDNVHKKERRILWNGNCREKRHSVVKIIIKHICQRLLTFKLFSRDDSKWLSKPNRLKSFNITICINSKVALFRSIYLIDKSNSYFQILYWTRLKISIFLYSLLIFYL